MKIEITGLHLDGHALKIPNGLSELLSSGNAWGEEEPTKENGYTREAVKKDGKLFTVLTKRK